MKILVACKVVVEEQDIVINGDNTLDFSRAAAKINSFDLNAIQAAVELKKSNDDIQLIGISVGDEKLKNSKIRKDLLSRGLDELAVVIKDTDTLKPVETSAALTELAKNTGFDLIICGEASADYFASQVGLRLGYKLNVPTVSGISKIVEIKDNAIVVERDIYNEIEKLEITLPAVISVTPDINIPDIPGMKAILAASKKSVVENDIAIETVNNQQIKSVLAPKNVDRLKHIIEGDDDEKIAKFISEIKNIM